MNILTFNHHESYIALLSGTQHKFYVVTKKGSLDLSWASDRIPKPYNVVFVEWDKTLEEKIKSGFFDLIIAHTIRNLLWIWPYHHVRSVFIAHIPLFKSTVSERVKAFIKRGLLRSFIATHPCQFVCISPWKLTTWGFSGTVIEPTINDFPQIIQNTPQKFRMALVCNHIKQRKEELGWNLVQKILDEFPLVIIGNNPDVPQSVRMKSFTEFQKYLQNFTVYFYPIQLPYGDGYNLALLEAMSMGMTPVTLYNPSSPIVHMENGLVAHDEVELKQHFRFLQDHSEECLRLGKAAKDTVEKRFSKTLFIEKWQKVLIGS